MTTTVKASSAAQFLSLLPRMLGFRPSRSVVLVPFSGSRSLGAMRFDLPTASDLDEIDRISATLIGMVCRLPDADGVAMVTFTDESFAERGMPHHALTDALQRRAEDCGIRVTDVLCQAADAWGSLFDPLCPRFGRPLSELDLDLDLDSPGATDVNVADGDQASGAELPRADLAEKERVGRALASLGSAVALLCGGESDSWPADAQPDDPLLSGKGRVDPQALEAACRLDDVPTLFEDALDQDPAALPPFEAALLIWCLSRPALRDIALVEWCRGMDAGDEALDAQMRWESGEEYPAHLAMQMWGEGEQPDPDRLRAALTLCRHLAARAPRAARPGVLATCAWLAWALGRSTHAERYALQARELEPEHGLAEIVLSFVGAAHLPDWAFRRR